MGHHDRADFQRCAAAILGAGLLVFAACDGCSSGRAGDGGDSDASADAGVDRGVRPDGGDVGGEIGRPWVNVSPSLRAPAALGHGSMAYDAARRNLVVVAEHETWIWDDQRWTKVPDADLHGCHAMAYDGAREEVVGFTTDGATWVWNGSEWRAVDQAANAELPGRRVHYAMAYDSVREATILFGGGGKGGAPDYLGDTWEWNGESWREVSIVGGPPARRDHAMAYFPEYGTIVLHGGVGPDGVFDDMWEWDGESWTEILPDGPFPRGQRLSVMTYDPRLGAVLLIGGYRRDTSISSTWAWDGTSWTNLVEEVGALPRTPGHRAAAYDVSDGQVVLFDTTMRLLGRTGSWTTRSWDLKEPEGLTGAVAYDEAREEVVLFGATQTPRDEPETWTWDGSSWRLASSTESDPPRRSGHAMTYDPVRERVVLFGGGIGGPRADTWEWDGATWTRVEPGGDPPPGRYFHAMAYDPGREAVVVAGGINFDHPFGTAAYAWDGSAWTRISEPLDDLRYSSVAMAYDEANERMLLFDGDWIRVLDEQGVRELTDTESGVPDLDSAATMFNMAWDGSRNRPILVGRPRDTDSGFHTWELVDDVWRDITPTAVGGCSGRGQNGGGYPSMVYDSRRRRVVCFGLDGRTWEWNGAVAQPPP